MTMKERTSLDLQQCRLERYEDNIKDLPDRIQNQAQWLKAKFDGRTDKEVMTQHNALIDCLAEYEVFRAVTSDDVRQVRLNEYNQLEVEKDDKWRVAGLGGHLMVTPDGRVLPMRERLAFRGEVEMEDDEEANSTVIYGVKGEQGNTGIVTTLNPGMFALSVGEDGHLYLTQNDNQPMPPLTVENGRLIYNITE